jgi:hypothetical protein
MQTHSTTSAIRALGGASAPTAAGRAAVIVSPVQRWLLAACLVVFSAVLLLLGLGVVVRAVEAGTLRPLMYWSGLYSMPAATPVVYQQPRLGEVGSWGRLDPARSSPLLWVERLGLTAWDAAFEDRDDKRMHRVYEAFSHISPEAGVKIQVMNRVGPYAQVEILEGPLRGKRGWIEPRMLTPE